MLPDVLPERFYTAGEVREVWWQWVRLLAGTRIRNSVPTSNGGLYYIGSGNYHDPGCPCDYCAAWRESDQLQVEYRKRSMGYDASIGKPWCCDLATASTRESHEGH